jgi:hypothetical protein
MISYIYAIHLAISIGCSFCVLVNRHVVACGNIVGLACLADFATRDLRPDMRLHHACVILVSALVNKHYKVLLVRNPEAFRDFMVLEISNVFLISQYFVSNVAYLKHINQALFVASFAYVRMYYYTKKVVFNTDINVAIFEICDNWIESYIVYLGIIGIFLLNLYWFYLILAKTARTLGIGSNSQKCVDRCEKAAHMEK